MPREEDVALALIVYPPTFDWSRMVQRPHHLLWEAARAGHVVIFCNATQRPDGTMERFSERLFVCHNFEALLRAGVDAPVVYFTDPAQTGLVRRLRPARAIFDVLDDLPATRPVWGQACALADEVWCASAELQRRVADLRPDAWHVPNAGDVDLWSAPPAEEPVAAAVLPHPRVLCLARFAAWVDLRGIAAAARDLPDVHFLLVGPVENPELFAADGLPNVHCIGERGYARLPGYAHACDAALLAYHADDATASAADPTKLWNLLATGRPLLASGVPAAEGLLPADRAVHPRDLTAALRGLLRNPGDEASAGERRAMAASRSWRRSWLDASAAWQGVNAG